MENKEEQEEMIDVSQAFDLMAERILALEQQIKQGSTQRVKLIEVEKNLPSLSVQTQEIDGSGSVIKSHFLQLEGRDLKECLTFAKKSQKELLNNKPSKIKKPKPGGLG